MSGQKIPINKTRREVFCADSWFTNYCKVDAMRLNGYYYMGQVKTGHQKIHQEFLEEEMMPFCPVSWIVLEHTSSSGMPLIYIGYKYNTKKALTFLMTKRCGNTTPDKGYETSYIREGEERVNKTFDLPDAISKYFQAAGLIDQNNHNCQEHTTT